MLWEAKGTDPLRELRSKVRAPVLTDSKARCSPGLPLVDLPDATSCSMQSSVHPLRAHSCSMALR